MSATAHTPTPTHVHTCKKVKKKRKINGKRPSWGGRAWRIVLGNKSRLRGPQANAVCGHWACQEQEPPCLVSKHPCGLRVAEESTVRQAQDLQGTGKVHTYSPALAAASTNVPLP